MLLSRFIGMYGVLARHCLVDLLTHFHACSLANLPNALHHTLVTYLSSPTYPRTALQAKVDLLCSFLSHRIGHCLASDDLGSYADDWMVRACARAGSLLCPSRARLLPVRAKGGLPRSHACMRSRGKRKEAPGPVVGVLRHAHRLAWRACARAGLSDVGVAERVRRAVVSCRRPLDIAKRN